MAGKTANCLAVLRLFLEGYMTEKEKNVLLEKVYEFGAYKGHFVDVANISVLEEFRALCEQNACGNYGKSYMCPPDVGKITDLMAKLKTYRTALVYQTVNQLEDSYDFEGMMDAGQKTNDLAQELTQWLKDHNHTNFLHLGAGGCRVCEQCGKKDDISCRFPDKAMASLETYGVNVSELALLADMKYINGQNTVTFFGSVFFK